MGAGVFAQKYLEKLGTLLQKAVETQLGVIKQAGELVAEAIVNGGILHVFGVGHSHMLAEETFFRAGGLAAVNAILEPSLMLHQGVLKSARLENLSGFAQIILDYHEVKEKDVLLLVSNSGVSVVPIEMAIEAKRRNVPTIAITSVRYSQEVKGNRKALFEIVDLVIDNGGEPGDALLELPGLSQRVGPSSTVVGAALVNAVVIEAISSLMSKGIQPPVYMSSHLLGAMDHNLKLARQYATRVRAL